MHVLFVEPCFPQNQAKFVRALHSVGAKVTGIGEVAPRSVPSSVRECLHAYEQVRSVVHEPSLLEAVRRCQQREWVDRLEATIEAHIMPVAKVRAACGIPGTSPETAFLCRDKPAMKDALRRAGVPCANSGRARSSDDIREFAAANGYPLIIKPADAAGASGVERVSSASELEAAIARSQVDRGASVAVEEFVEGHEGFYDTISIGGKVVHEFISHYYPNVLVAMRNRWISPQIVATNRTDASSYDELRQMAQRVNTALGIGTSATHMEWFFGPKGLRFSEIGCRPPGVGAWDLYCAGNDMDLYREWAHAIVYQCPEGRPSRAYAAGLIALRPDRDGEIVGTEGLEPVLQRYGSCIIDTHIPRPGTRTQPVEAGYWANAWMRVRHPDYDTLCGILDDIGRSVQVRAR
ncbi:MAG: acetyl-CoA carboxylase biotin carboxylase subunit family protein [Planctomycetota bacterium]